MAAAKSCLIQRQSSGEMPTSWRDVQINGTVRESLLVSGARSPEWRDRPRVQINGGALHIGRAPQITGNLRYRVPAKDVHIDSARASLEQ